MSNLSSRRTYETPAAITQIGRLERITLGERVHAELREQLMSGELASGQRMSFHSMAETLRVSIMPVREAVARLASDQPLEVFPNRAVRVPLMTKARFRELTAVRLAVEGFAAEVAARSRTESDLAAMHRFEEALLAEARSPEPRADQAVRANKELHFAVYGATGLPTLVGIIEGLWLKIRPVLNFDKASPERLRTGGAIEHHRRLVEAVAAEDGAAARQALVDDIKGAASFIESTGRLLS